MDAEKSFSYPFEDPDWLSKLGVGALVSMIPILNFLWSGYLVEIIRNVMDDVSQPLPPWDALDNKFRDGLILFGAGLVYAFPVLIGLCLPLGIAASSGFFAQNGNLQDLSRAIAEAGGILFVGLLCIFLLYGLVLSILYPVILVLFARQGTFASCFKLREAFEIISKNTVAFFIAWGLSLLASLGVGLIVAIVNTVVGFVPCLGWIIGLVVSLGSGVYSTAVFAHLFGQFGRTALGSSQLAPARDQ